MGIFTDGWMSFGLDAVLVLAALLPVWRILTPS